jgi:Transcription initiation factor TFIIIB, Brf1 subunit/Transcription initiation factor TFIIB
LIKELHFSIPNVDPCLYIWRFCEKLDFGDKKNEVGMTALRILKSMKRDWMFHGRRPTGLVGAAILIAARYHGFKRTTNQIIQTVHVCDETIKKRLVEFKQTDTAKFVP